MIDDYEYRRIHEKERSEFWTLAKVIAASFAAVVTVIIQSATFIVLLTR